MPWPSPHLAAIALGLVLALHAPAAFAARARSSEQNIQDALTTGVQACNAAGQPSSSASQVIGVVTYDAKAPPWVGQTATMGVVFGPTHTTCVQDREGTTAANGQLFRVELVLPRGTALASAPVACSFGSQSAPCPQPVTARPGIHGGVQLAYGGRADGRFPLAPFTQVRLSFEVKLRRAINGLGKRAPECGRLEAPCTPQQLKRFAEIVVDDDERATEPAQHSTVSSLLPLYALRLGHLRTRAVPAATLRRGLRLHLSLLPPKARVVLRLRAGGTTVARRVAKAGKHGGTAAIRLRPRASRRAAIRPNHRLRLDMTLTAPGVKRQRSTSWIHVR